MAKANANARPNVTTVKTTAVIAKPFTCQLSLVPMDGMACSTRTNHEPADENAIINSTTDPMTKPASLPLDEVDVLCKENVSIGQLQQTTAILCACMLSVLVLGRFKKRHANPSLKWQLSCDQGQKTAQVETTLSQQATMPSKSRKSPRSSSRKSPRSSSRKSRRSSSRRSRRSPSVSSQLKKLVASSLRASSRSSRSRRSSRSSRSRRASLRSYARGQSSARGYITASIRQPTLSDLIRDKIKSDKDIALANYVKTLA